jgi:hypothetical protein
MTTGSVPHDGPAAALADGSAADAEGATSLGDAAVVGAGVVSLPGAAQAAIRLAATARAAALASHLAGRRRSMSVLSMDLLLVFPVGCLVPGGLDAGQEALVVLPLFLLERGDLPVDPGAVRLDRMDFAHRHRRGATGEQQANRHEQRKRG